MKSEPGHLHISGLLDHEKIHNVFTGPVSLGTCPLCEPVSQDVHEPAHPHSSQRIGAQLKFLSKPNSRDSCYCNSATIN